MPDANTLEALAKLAWPLIVIVLIILFRPAIFAIIESEKIAGSPSSSGARN